MKLENRSVKSLKKEADKWFSIYIRKKYADEEGNVKCITCNKKKPIKEMQNGHFVSRIYTALRWFEKNCAPQDYSCNVMMMGNKDEFAKWLIDTYGIGIIEELNELKHRKAEPLTKELLLHIINTTKEKIKLIENENNEINNETVGKVD